jgi:hypothetical protein
VTYRFKGPLSDDIANADAHERLCPTREWADAAKALEVELTSERVRAQDLASKLDRERFLSEYWRAEAEAAWVERDRRPEITPEDAKAWLSGNDDDSDVADALRTHAGKAVG